MWRNPNTILGPYVPFIVKRLTEANFPAQAIKDPAFETNPTAHALIRQMLNRLQESWQDSKANERLVRKELLGLARAIDAGKDWQLIPGIWRIIDDYEGRLSEHLVAALGCIARAVHFLVGSEQRHLVGTRSNQPAWKQYDAHEKTGIELLLSTFLIDSDVEYLDGDDLDLIPELDEWLLEDDLPQLPRIRNCWQEVGALLEDAYYNQQYLPNAGGSYVRLRGLPGIDGAIIKTKRSLLDPGYIDFIACFELGKKKFLSIFSGIMISAATDLGSEWKITLYGDPSKRDFFFWLTAQIYHDLVTAKEIEPRQFRGPKTPGSNTVKEKVSAGVEWMYIPRTHKKGKSQEIRREANVKRSVAPHRVRGYKRSGNMTEKQKVAIRKLEEELGVEILRWIPEGHTFVRPHIVPSSDSKTHLGLPRFIRGRIQEDIKRLLKS